MKRLIYFILIGAGALAAIYGCEKATIDNGTTDKPLTGGSGAPVKFSTDIIPIFNSKCILCHGTGGQTPCLEASVVYNNLISGGFVNTANPAASIIYVQVTTVHEGKMTQPEEEKLLAWITQGALNN